jgi:hypothetical protein
VRALAASAAFVAAAFGLAACMEVEQTVGPPKAGKYQGKPDTPAWANEPLAHETARWTKGDRASWEAQIKARQLAQHEDRRIYQ